jgi:hypothetical protein
MDSSDRSIGITYDDIEMSIKNFPLTPRDKPNLSLMQEIEGIGIDVVSATSNMRRVK